MRISALRSVLFVAALLAALMPVDLAAKNLDLLTRLLIPGYIAQDFAALCSDDPGFLPGVRSGSASIAAYAQHLKIEITVNLTQAEAMDVMRVAADTALVVARKESRKVLPKEPSGPSEVLKDWCERSARPFILAIMKEHVEKHGEFDRIVRAAKR